jgi:hypothetical protein
MSEKPRQAAKAMEETTKKMKVDACSWLLHCDLRVISRDFGFVSSLFLSLALCSHLILLDDNTADVFFLI